MGRKKKKSKARRPAATPVAKETSEKERAAVDSTPATCTSGERAELEWPADQTDQNRLLTALKYQTLGPFLFAQRTLCHEAEMYAMDADLLPRDEGVWPTFFEQSQWKSAELVVQVVLTSSHLCETNQSFRDYLFTGKSVVLKDGGMVAKLLKLHSKMMVDYTTSEVEVVYRVLRLQVLSLGVAGVSSPAYLFLEGLREKEQLVLPIKDRGNTNFRESRYRAAIGDYTRAIRLSPYSAVLYCNRALCYLRNGDTWNACVDSYRALVLKPDWEKPYYRCSEAWMLLGNLTVAKQVNGIGCDVCPVNSDLNRQKKEIMVSMEKQEHVPQAPPTSHTPTMTSSVKAAGDAKRNEKGERSTSDSTHSQPKQDNDDRTSDQQDHVTDGESHVTNGASHVTDKVGHVMDGVDHVSDLDDITDHDPPELSEGGGAEREPIEDDNEWHFPHTTINARDKPNLGRVPMGLGEMRRMFNMDDRPHPLRQRSDEWMMDRDESGEEEEEEEGCVVKSEEDLAEIQAREMEEYKRKEKEREKIKTERQAMRSGEEKKLAHSLPPANPYTGFESLMVATLTPDLSTDQLFAMVEKTPSRKLMGAQYTAHSEAWRSMEPLPDLRPPIRPKPPSGSFTGTFDELWCPMLADVTETADIIPPRLHYVGNMVTKYMAHYPPHFHRYEF